MPRRRRANKRKGGLAGPYNDLFVHGDGLSHFFDTDACYENAMLARSAWCQCRRLSWQHPWRGMWPPHGAHWDGITDATDKTDPTGMGRAWSAEAVRAAVAIDRASVAHFRDVDPEGAAEVAEELDRYLEDLGVLVSIAEQCADRRNESGYSVAGREAWAKYEMRRRDEQEARWGPLV